MIGNLHVPEDIPAGCLELYAIRDTASIEYTQPQGNNACAEHDPVIDVMDAGSLDR